MYRSSRGEGQKKRQLKYKKCLKQVKWVEDWGGGRSIACSKESGSAIEDSASVDDSI